MFGCFKLLLHNLLPTIPTFLEKVGQNKRIAFHEVKMFPEKQENRFSRSENVSVKNRYRQL